MDQVYGGFQLAFEYQRSFDAARLARGMFGSNVLNFAGSSVAAPVANSLLADNFGLSQNFQGSVSLKPVIQSYNLHFDWFVGLDEWVKGLYFQFDMNFEHQKRELNGGCFTSTSTTVVFPVGYMSAAASTVAPVADLRTALGLQTLFGDKKTATKYGRFDFCDRTESGIAGLSMNFGYDFARCDDYFLGAFFRVVAPTGSKVKPCYVFDSIVGNGKGWELGAGISSRWEMWNNNDCQKLTAMLDGYVVSVLNHHSLRTFDLASTNTALRVDYTCANSCNNSCAVNSCAVNSCNNSCAVNSCNTSCAISNCSDSCGLSGCSTGCSSSNDCNSGCNNCNALNCLTRYQLLQQFNLAGGVYTYANNLITAADFTTRNVDVRTAVKGDATLRLVYTHGGFDLGFGYNVFGMSREKITSVGQPDSCIFTATGQVYGVKGCHGVAYLAYPTSGTSNSDTIVSTTPIVVPYVATRSNATAYANGCNGVGNGCGTPDNPVTIVPFVLNGTPVLPVNFASTAPITVNNTIAATEAEAGFVAPALSVPPVVLSGAANELDLCSGTAPRQFTNKGFVSLDYTWVDNDWAPYLGFIAEVEGGTRNTDVAQWGVVIRGGVSY